MTRALGVDFSHWQSVVDWQKTVDAGISFAFLKCTQGTTIIDSQYLNNHTWAGSKGILRAPYHYYIDASDPIQQADFFFSNARPSEIPPALDFEKYLPQTLTGSKMKAFTMRVIELFGRLPIIYTNADSWNSVVGDKTWGPLYKLWPAQYPYANWFPNLIADLDDNQPIKPPGFTSWSFWQFTSKAPGETYGAGSATVDLNFYNGTVEQLREDYPLVPPADDDYVTRAEFEEAVASLTLLLRPPMTHRVVTTDPNGEKLHNNPDTGEHLMLANGTEVRKLTAKKWKGMFMYGLFVGGYPLWGYLDDSEVEPL